MRFIRRFKQDLAKEVTEWVADDLIDEDQAILILQRYGITPGQPYNLGYTLLIGLGFLFIGLSVITLIGANWDEIPRVARMSGLIALTAGTHLVGIWFYGKTQVNKSVAYFFLGNLFFWWLNHTNRANLSSWRAHARWGVLVGTRVFTSCSTSPQSVTCDPNDGAGASMVLFGN